MDLTADGLLGLAIDGLITLPEKVELENRDFIRSARGKPSFIRFSRLRKALS